MTHTEQISVYRYEKTDDGFGGYEPAQPTLLTLAPSWATVRHDTGDDLGLNERFTTANRFTITCNYRDDFNWARDMFIVRENGDVIDINGIRETVRKRKVELSGVYIVGVDETGQGTPSAVGELNTIYYNMLSDAATVNIPQIAGRTVYLIFRDGIEKKKVASNPQPNEVQVNDDELSLVAGDIFFAGERITILYK